MGRGHGGENGMKLGITDTLEHSCPEEWAEKHWKLGCTTVVFPLDCTASAGEIERYRSASIAYGLTIAEVGSEPQKWMAGKGRQEQVLFCKEQLRLAERLQAGAVWSQLPWVGAGKRRPAGRLCPQLTAEDGGQAPGNFR